MRNASDAGHTELARCLCNKGVQNICWIEKFTVELYRQRKRQETMYVLIES
jgi:hypothetical protein